MISHKFSAAAAAMITLLSLSACKDAPVPGDLLDPEAFTTEMDGKPVSLYTITNGTITAQVTNFGGYVVGLFTPDKDGNYANVVGHNDNIEQYQSFSMNPVGSALGRFANRIGNASFTLDGVEYQLTKNNGQHILHGGSKGFGNIVWDVEKITWNSLRREWMSVVLIRKTISSILIFVSMVQQDMRDLV